MLNQLRYGRGVDNRLLKAAGFEYGYTSREAVIKLGEHLRLHPLLRATREPYRYEREVEDFLRWSPNVRSSRVRSESTLSRGQLAELQRLLAGYEGTIDRPDEPPAAEPGPPPEPESARPEPAPQSTPDQPAKTPDPPPTGQEPGGPGGASPQIPSSTGQEPGGPGGASPQIPSSYDDLEAEEIVSLLGSLETGDLQVLRRYEAEHRDRSPVVAAIDSVLARRRAPTPG
jgi:hypothetical protein